MSNFLTKIFGHAIAMEVYRLLPLLGLAGIVIIPDDGSHVVLFGTAIILFAVAIAHVVRRLLFPYINIKDLISGISEDTKASAAVICGIIYLVCTIIMAFVMMFK